MKINIRVIFPIALLFFSCEAYNKLSKSDLEWQPYKEGDKLIFESNRGELDTIQIEEIKIYSNPNDPLAVFPKMRQTLFVIGERSILEMRAGENGSYIEFTVRLGSNNLKYPNVVLNIKEMNEMNQDQNNQYKIEAKEYYDNMKDRVFDLRYIYWSKKWGYMSLKFKDNYEWHLKSFIRDGKNILGKIGKVSSIKPKKK